jgi:hypothetical protein
VKSRLDKTHSLRGVVENVVRDLPDFSIKDFYDGELYETLVKYGIWKNLPENIEVM